MLIGSEKTAGAAGLKCSFMRARLQADLSIKVGGCKLVPP